MSTQDHQLPTTKTDVVPAQADPPHADPPTENPGSLRIVGIVAAVALLLAIAYGLHLRSASEKNLTIATDEAAIPTVTVVHPVAGSEADDLALPGNVEAFTDTPIYSRTDGYLKKWYFDIGAHVHKGDLLAEVETPEIDQQLNQSQAELERMQADADLAGVTSNRWQTLLAKHAVSQQEADQTRSNYIAAQAAVDASRANVRRLEQLQSYERIIAPFDGVITARNTDIGDLITAGSGSASPRELFHLDASSRLRVYVSIPEVDSDSIHDGDEATLTQDANPNLKINGRIVRNADAINQ
jgi:RND family efflux transporter MFP subunit